MTEHVCLLREEGGVSGPLSAPGGCLVVRTLRAVLGGQRLRASWAESSSPWREEDGPYRDGRDAEGWRQWLPQEYD